MLAAALAAKPAPLDGVTRSFRTERPVEEDAGHAASLGFGGKLLIHPAQLAPAIRGFMPADEAVEEARAVLSRAGADASGHQGEMVDRAVVEAARWQIEAAERARERLASIRDGSAHERA